MIMDVSPPFGVGSLQLWLSELQAVDAMLPQIRERCRKSTATGAEAPGFASDDAEEWDLSLMEKIFDAVKSKSYRLLSANGYESHIRHGNRNSGAGRDQRFPAVRVPIPPEGYTHPVCTHVRETPGECRRVLVKADKKPDASGRVYALPSGSGRQYFRTSCRLFPNFRTYFRKNFPDNTSYSAMLTLTLSFFPETETNLQAPYRMHDGVKRVEEQLQGVVRAEVLFARVFIAMGCSRCELKEQDIPRLLFAHVMGHYEFLVMPFGSHECQLSKEEQRSISALFTDFTTRRNYMPIFQVRIWMSKVAFHLGHIVSAEGNYYGSAKVEAIPIGQEPTSVTRICMEEERGKDLEELEAAFGVPHAYSYSHHLVQVDSSFTVMLSKKERWLELLKDYDTKHSSPIRDYCKAQVVVDALIGIGSMIAAQKDDGEIWAIILNMISQTEFHVGGRMACLLAGFDADVPISKQHFGGGIEARSVLPIVSDRDPVHVSFLDSFTDKLGEPGFTKCGHDYICCERILEGPEMIEVTNEKVAVARGKLKEAQTRQKSYADRHRRALEFQPGPFESLDRVGGFLSFGVPSSAYLMFTMCFMLLLRGQSHEKQDDPYVKILWREPAPVGTAIGRTRSLYGNLLSSFSSMISQLRGVAPSSYPSSFRYIMLDIRYLEGDWA
ncbi:hypothetical protein Tco_0018331 [Tanacetum coccineum]